MGSRLHEACRETVKRVDSGEFPPACRKMVDAEDMGAGAPTVSDTDSFYCDGQANEQCLRSENPWILSTGHPLCTL